MRNAKIILVAAMAISLAGCVLGGKPKTVATPPTTPKPATPVAPPEPLSSPQTTVVLPPYQPVNLDGLKPPPQVEAAPVQTKPVTNTAPVTHPNRQTNLPAKPPDPPAAPDTTPAPEVRPLIQEIVPADVQKQLGAKAEDYKAQVGKLLAGIRRLNTSERNTVQAIKDLVKQSDQAEANNDMRAAAEYAEKAYVLAKELRSGK